jgi:hypothetical protein
MLKIVARKVLLGNGPYPLFEVSVRLTFIECGVKVRHDFKVSPLLRSVRCCRRYLGA